ncbi:MAG: hypothetical protein M3P51_08840 [Chloroflexota bacterium]|nr:hypothetical protein [Chloroflexota bacterium]
MAFSDIPHNEAELVTVRTIGRLAQLLLELRAEYERRPNEATLAQIRHRIRELSDLEQQLGPDNVRAVS